MSLINKIYKDDVGTEILLDCKVDILTASVRQIRVSKPSGAEALWHCAVTGSVGTLTIAAGGSGYSVNNVLTVVQAGGSGATFRVVSVGVSGDVTGISLITSGSGYVPGTFVSTTGGGGSGCSVNIVDLSYATVLKYIILPGDLNEAGIYKLQAYVVLPQWRGRGETVTFEVYDSFK